MTNTSCSSSSHWLMLEREAFDRCRRHSLFLRTGETKETFERVVFTQIEMMSGNNDQTISSSLGNPDWTIQREISITIE